MEWISTYGGTATAGPNFSYVLATRALDAGRRARPVAAAGRAERRRADRPRPGRGLRRGRRPPRPAPRRGVPGVRHGRGRHRRHVPRADARAWPPTASTGGCSRPSATPRPVEPGADGSRRLRAARARPVPGLEIRIVDPETGAALQRPRGRRARDPGHLGDARLLQAARRQRRAVPRRLAAHRRPRLHARRRAA